MNEILSNAEALSLSLAGLIGKTIVGVEASEGMSLSAQRDEIQQFTLIFSDTSEMIVESMSDLPVDVRYLPQRSQNT